MKNEFIHTDFTYSNIDVKRFYQIIVNHADCVEIGSWNYFVEQVFYSKKREASSLNNESCKILFDIVKYCLQVVSNFN